MAYKSGDPYVILFTTSNPSTGAAQNADSTPVLTANHNGTDDGSFSAALVVANIETGVYKGTGTIPSYSSGDVLSVRVTATVAGVTGKAVIDTQIIDSKRVSDLNDITSASVWSVTTRQLTGSQAFNNTGQTTNVPIDGSIVWNYATRKLSATQSFNNTAQTTALPIDLTKKLGAPRALDSVADGSLTINDGLHCAIASAAGKESTSGSTYLVQTPSTGTTLRTFTISPSVTSPTSRS